MIFLTPDRRTPAAYKGPPSHHAFHCLPKWWLPPSHDWFQSQRGEYRWVVLIWVSFLYWFSSLFVFCYYIVMFSLFIFVIMFPSLCSFLQSMTFLAFIVFVMFLHFSSLAHCCMFFLPCLSFFSWHLSTYYCFCSLAFHPFSPKLPYLLLMLLLLDIESLFILSSSFCLIFFPSPMTFPVIVFITFLYYSSLAHIYPSSHTFNSYNSIPSFLITCSLLSFLPHLSLL